MKNKILLLGLIGIFLFSINFVSASSIYNWRYQGPANEPSTSYYTGAWSSKSSGDGYASGYVPISAKLKTFNGPYTQVHVQNTAPYPRPAPAATPSPTSNNFQAGGGYTPSSSFGGYGYYGGYGGYVGYYGYGYSPTYYAPGYSYSYYDSYYPAYYW